MAGKELAVAELRVGGGLSTSRGLFGGMCAKRLLNREPQKKYLFILLGM